MKTILFNLIILSSSVLIKSELCAQTDTSKIYSNLIKTYIEESTENNNNPNILDLIEELLRNPINLNTANENELMQIPFVDYKSAKLILQHRKNHGKFSSVHELMGVIGLTNKFIEKIKPFLFVKKPLLFESSHIGNMSFNYRSRYIYNLENNAGFIGNKFAGSRIKSYQRFNFNYGKFHSMFLGEKDAGETSFIDHSTFFIEAKQLGPINHFIVGNYIVEFGQGLILWSPYSFSKGSDAINPVIKRDRNIIAYSSSDENNFFNGAALNFERGKFKFTLFYSSMKIDANLADSSNEIISLPNDGFHRTEGELNNKDKIIEDYCGGEVVYSVNSNFFLGFLYTHNSYNNNIIYNPIFFKSGNSFANYSLSYKIYLYSLMISGETAYNGLSLAHISSLEFPLIKNFTFLVSIRSYPRNFTSFHGNSFGEKSKTSNEIGFYTGIKWKTNIGIFNFYFDQFKFPYASSKISLPTAGNEFLINYSTSPIRNTKISLRYKNENKEVSNILNSNKVILDRVTNDIRFDIYYKVSKSFLIISRLEYINIYKRIVNSREIGFLAFQNFQLNIEYKLKLYARIIFFQTDSFESRIYEFENDITGILNNPPMFGLGMRFYLLIKYSLGPLQISSKYSQLYKPDVRSLGSGLTKIDGNSQNSINFQIDYRF